MVAVQFAVRSLFCRVGKAGDEHVRFNDAAPAPFDLPPLAKRRYRETWP